MKIKKSPTPAGISSSSTKPESFYKAFPYELTHQDGDGFKTCWFCDDYDMNKYMERYKISKKNCKIVIHKQTSASS